MLKKLGITLFNGAGATGHVFLFRNGEPQDRGPAYSGWVGPKTTVAVVPTTPQDVPFSIDALTKDNQYVVTQGSLTVTFDAVTAVVKFDFTVEPFSGGYKAEWRQALAKKVIENVVRAVHAKIADLTIEEAVMVALAGEQGALKEHGLTVSSCSIPKITPKDAEVAASIGAKERQERLTAADQALHGRRMKASESQRTLQQYEADTARELEEKKAALLDEQAKNMAKQAKMEAEATATRLGPLMKLSPGALLGAALMRGFESGSIGSINVGPELFGAMKTPE